uniref:Proline-rich coiled-coil 2A n=1 Tax=Scophthalmus maximus TaxID=52904 RepID=A0A8D3BEX0_SCOMX
MSERSGQTAKGKDGKTKYASLNLFDTYKGKSLETQKPVVPPRHGLQSLGKVASARRMPPPAYLPSLKAENKGNDPNVSLVPKDGTGWASNKEPADPKSTDALSAPQPELQQPVASQTPAPTRPRTPPASEALAPATTQAVGARSWAQASVTHGTQGDVGKGSNQPSPFYREEFPTLQAAGDQDKAGREQGTADQWYGPGPSLRPQNVTSWRDGGGRAQGPPLPGEGAAEGGTGGALVMDGAAGVPLPNSHGPPRNPPAGSPALPLPQPPVGPGFPQYRGIMPPFMYPPYLPFPAPYGPQGPYRYPGPGEGPAPRFSRGPDSRPQGGLRDTGGEAVNRPPILKQDDLKELDELDHDGDDGWAGAHEEIDYSAKLKFSDDEGEGDGEEGAEEERTESQNDSREQPRPQDAPPAASRPRASDSGGDTRRTPPSNADNGPQPPSSKSGWAEEGGNSWRVQGASSNYQDRPHNQGASAGPGKPGTTQPQPAAGGPTPPPQPGVLVHGAQGEDEDETWRQRRKQSSSEISAAVERARRRREEEERRMEEERRAACAEKLKRLDEKQQQQQGSEIVGGGGSGSKTPSLDGNSTTATAGSPTPSISASASSPNISQPPSPCVDSEEPPVLTVQPGPSPGGSDRQRASSNSSYDSSADVQQCPQPAVSQPQQPTLDVPLPVENKEETVGGSHIRAGSGSERGIDPVKIENIGGAAGRQAGGPLSQGYSKYQKSLPPRFQRQQQEQLMKQQQQWQQQQQHSQASQSQLSSQPQPPQGPSPGPTPQPGPGPKQGGPMYQPSNMVRPPPLPMNFDPRWMMMPYMDPRMMQGRPPPMDYYSTGMHPSGLIGRERSDSGGSGSDPFDRQQQHPGHPQRGTPPMDPKLAWGPEVFPGGGEGRGLTSPLRQKQVLEDDDVAKGPRSDTPPHRMREGVLGPIQQPGSSSGTSNQTPPPVGSQVGGQGGSHHPHHYMGGRGNYSNFPDQGGRMAPHQQQQRASERGNQPHGFTHQEDGPPRGSQQGQIWGAPHPHYDRNGRADLPPVENNSHLHLHHHHSHHPQQPHFPLHAHKPENNRDRVVDATAKKTNSSPPLHQPSLSSSCSSSSSSSSAREDGSVKVALHHHPSQRDGEAVIGHSHSERSNSGNAGSSGHVKQEKTGPAYASHSTVTSSPPPAQHGSHSQQHHPHPKSNQRGGREHKTETQWGPRPGSSNIGGGSSHGRRANNAGVGTSSRGGEDSSNIPSDHKSSNQTGGGNANKRAGPIKKPVLKEMKREGGEADGGEKTNPGFGKDKDQDGGQLVSMKQEASQNQSAPSKDEPAQTAKPRNGGKERSSGGGGGGSGRGHKDVDGNSSGFSGPSRRDRDRSFERGGSSSHHQGVPPKGSRASRGRGGEFFGRGRGYRGTYTPSAGPTAGSRGGRMGGRSGRDYRPSVGGGHHQESKAEGPGGRHGQDRSQHNPARARNRSETRSEGSEYEEIPKRRRERGSETGSESGASDIGHSDKDDNQKPNTKNGSANANTTGSGSMSSAHPRGSQARVFTPRGVPSRRGRGGGGSGGSGGGNIYRSGGNVGGPPGGHRVGPSSGSHGGSNKSSTSSRKQQGPPQTHGPKDLGRGGNSGEKKDKIADTSQVQSQGTNPPQPSLPATTPATVGSTENGGVVTQQASTNPTSNSGGPNTLPLPANRGFPPGGFERPPRRRRHGRSQHQQDKPPRFRRLKERENAARINGVGVIGGGRPSSPALNSVQDSNGAPLPAPTTGNSHHANHNAPQNTNSNSGGGHIGNSNSHHHHHYNQGNAVTTHPQHHHSHGAKSPDFTNQNSDQANEEWETASESSDFTEFRDREGGGGGGGGGGKSYPSHHHHHPGRGGGGGGGVQERDMSGKEPLANKRSFSSQRPGMDRQNRRVNPERAGGGGGRGPRGPPGGGSGGPGNGGGNRGEKRGNWPSPKNRK